MAPDVYLISVWEMGIGMVISKKSRLTRIAAARSGAHLLRSNSKL